MPAPQVNRHHAGAPDLAFWRGGPMLPHNINPRAAAAQQARCMGGRGWLAVSTDNPDERPEIGWRGIVHQDIAVRRRCERSNGMAQVMAHWCNPFPTPGRTA